MAPKGPLTESPNRNRNADSKAQEVPIFLRKTFHMINTCDVNVASWGEDGLTFVVKNPIVFEKVIIPQFFKHSKFTSFVRQLNFYGFRKIKYSDSIRINTVLEEKTANFWRFRHDNFRKGREDLLVEIKRSNSNRPSNSTSDGRVKLKASKGAAGKKTIEKTEEVVELKNELNTLKSRIAQMTNNIDELTTLVQNVTLKDSATNAAVVAGGVVTSAVDSDPVDNSAAAGNKRKKLHGPMDMVVDEVTSSAPISTVSAVPVSTSTNPLDDITFTPTSIFPSEPVLTREGQGDEPVSDDDFVDELFNFGDDIASPDLILSAPSTPISLSPVSSPMRVEDNFDQKPNAPDGKMMDELSDALTLLPKDIQEMLVNRLITTITSSDTLKSHIDAVVEEKKTKKERKPDVIEKNPDVALPLAAATLTALMTQFSVAMKDKKNPVLNKSLPVISIHA